MDIAVFNEAQEAYSAGDYDRALAGFSICTRGLDDLPPEEVSKFYHLIGNCYIKSGNPNEAAEYYAKALHVCTEDRKPSLFVNLGTALLSADRNEEALKAFNAALKSEEYPTPYKAYSGIGSAQLKLGDMTAAGAAYREAALDPTNPMPAKALVNLGVCFMELGRADDAIVSYETALDLGLSPQAAGKAYANLGQAYMTQGRVTDAIAAFEAAEADGSYELSPIARHDLDIARLLEKRFGATLAGTAYAAAPKEEPEPEIAVEPEPEFEAEEDQLDEAPEVDPYASTIAFPAVVSDEPEDSFMEEEEVWHGSSFSDYPEDGDDLIPSPENTDFFDISEKDINDAAKKARKKEKKARKKGHGVRNFFIVLIILIVLVAGAGAAGYFLGYGYPTQEQVATEFVQAVQNGSGTGDYWNPQVSQTDRSACERQLADLSSYEVTAVERSSSRTIVYLDAKASEGGHMYYQIYLDRDRISWQVSDVELYFPSAQ